LKPAREFLKCIPAKKQSLASGLSETELVREAQRLGAGAYIKKPYVLERIGLAGKSGAGEVILSG